MDQVNEFRSIAPKHISRWGRANSIYNWIGSIVRYKKRYWTNGEVPPFGLVIEVGRASWLVALWERDNAPKDHINGMEVDRWWTPDIHELKEGILSRKFSEDELRERVSSLDYDSLMKV